MLLLVSGEAAAIKAQVGEANVIGGASLWPLPYSDSGRCSFALNAAYLGDLESTKQTARVFASGGVVVGGDSVIACGPDGIQFRHVVVKRMGRGPVRVWSSLLVETKNPKTYDFYERTLEVQFQHLRDKLDTVRISDQRVSRWIAVRDGKRFRYAGLYFVAIEDDEKQSPLTFERRAEVVSMEGIPCPECGLKDTLEVPVVVTVGSKGKVTWARVEPYRIGAPVGGRNRLAERMSPAPLDPKVWRAIELGLKRFRYRSAIGDGHPVADYATFTVRVVP